MDAPDTFWTSEGGDTGGLPGPPAEGPRGRPEVSTFSGGGALPLRVVGGEVAVVLLDKRWAPGAGPFPRSLAAGTGDGAGAGDAEGPASQSTASFLLGDRGPAGGEGGPTAGGAEGPIASLLLLCSTHLSTIPAYSSFSTTIELRVRTMSLRS